GLEADVARREMLLRAPQRLVQAAERRAAIAGDESRGVDAGGGVARALQHHQADQRLGAGEENPAALERELIVQRGGGQGCAVYGGVHRARDANYPSSLDIGRKSPIIAASQHLPDPPPPLSGQVGRGRLTAAPIFLSSGRARATADRPQKAGLSAASYTAPGRVT